jgi:hypothetical protein
MAADCCKGEQGCGYQDEPCDLPCVIVKEEWDEEAVSDCKIEDSYAEAVGDKFLLISSP